MSDRFYFSDNVRVARSRYGSEYFAVRFQEPHGDGAPDQPAEVSFDRYCVPGRCDTYGFEWQGHSIGYHSEGNANMVDRLAMFHADLEKPQVVALIIQAISKRDHYQYARTFVELLLDGLAPKRSKGMRKIRAAWKKIEEERQQRLETRRAQRLQEARELVARADGK